MYTTLGVDGAQIRLIELRLALADNRPGSDLSALGKREAYSGYWVRAIPHKGDDPAKPDRNRFAYVAFPVDSPKHHRNTDIMDENKTTWKAVLLAGSNVTAFPRDPGEVGWSKLDSILVAADTKGVLRKRY